MYKDIHIIELKYNGSQSIVDKRTDIKINFFVSSCRCEFVIKNKTDLETDRIVNFNNQQKKNVCNKILVTSPRHGKM